MQASLNIKEIMALAKMIAIADVTEHRIMTVSLIQSKDDIESVTFGHDLNKSDISDYFWTRTGEECRNFPTLGLEIKASSTNAKNGSNLGLNPNECYNVYFHLMDVAECTNCPEDRSRQQTEIDNKKKLKSVIDQFLKMGLYVVEIGGEEKTIWGHQEMIDELLTAKKIDRVVKENCFMLTDHINAQIEWWQPNPLKYSTTIYDSVAKVVICSCVPIEGQYNYVNEEIKDIQALAQCRTCY